MSTTWSGAPGVKYRDVRHRDEVEQSKYAFGQIDMPAAELHALHRNLFDQYYVLAANAAALEPGAAGARLLPEVLAHVQPARRERRHRRDRAHGLHPESPAAGGGDCQGVGGGGKDRRRDDDAGLAEDHDDTMAR